MTFNSFETVLLTSLFLLPGFIILSIVNTFSPRKDGNDFHEMLRFLSYSIVNLGFWSWAYILLFELSTTWLFWFLLILITFFGSAILGILIGIQRKKTLLRALLYKISKINISHPVPLAWDFKFSNTNSRWVIITLNNGDTVAGLFSWDSLASSDFSDRDIYIEKVYRIDNEKNWIMTPNSDGILISSNAIQHIEFFINNN